MILSILEPLAPAEREQAVKVIEKIAGVRCLDMEVTLCTSPTSSGAVRVLTRLF